MKNVRKILILILSVLFLVAFAGACSDEDDSGSKKRKQDNSVTENATPTDAQNATPTPRFKNRPNADEKTGTIKELEAGDVAPEFTAPMTGEKDFRMSDHDDEVVLLNFWATWCGPCVKEMNDLGKLADEYKGKAVVCCISVGDDWRTVCQFANERPNLREYLGCADGTAISDFYPSDYIPYTVITKGGIVQATYVGSRSYDDYKKILDSYLD